MRWQFGPVLPPEIRSHMCEPEITFFSQYNKGSFTNYVEKLIAFLKISAPPLGLDMLSLVFHYFAAVDNSVSATRTFLSEMVKKGTNLCTKKGRITS